MSTFKRNPKVEEAPLQNEMMLFNPVSSQFYLLNRTMAYIWQNCETRDVDGLIVGLAEEFEGTDAVSASDDVRKAVGELLSLGLIVDAPRSTP